MTFQTIAPVSAPKITCASMRPASTMAVPIVFATWSPKTANAMKLKNAAQITAVLGFSTRVDTTVAIEFAASCRPFMHAIGKDRPRSKDALIFSTQSTHKLLAGLSQASQILVQYSDTRQLDRYRFNEAYLMHSSTSPQYAIIASCDVAAAMMEPPGGTALVEESIMERSLG